MTTAEQVIRLLGLQPHPEGGFFAESYRADESTAGAALPSRYGGPRAFSTAIYYMVTAESPSLFHRVRSDEVWHFYAGDALDMFMLDPDGPSKYVVLGNELVTGARPQVVVPRGVWQGARVAAGGSFSLVGTTVAPGFDYADWEAATRKQLVAAYPRFEELIKSLTAS